MRNNNGERRTASDAGPAQGTRRCVAIIGRPNVGKSAIFNRIAGRRIAIVHSQSGVTRDRIACEVTWADRRFELIDTGGLAEPGRPKGADAVEQGIRRQAEAALESASVALLVVDVEAGLHPLDRDVAELLRRSSCATVFVVANKADNPDRDDQATEFAGLGFPVYPVSALHDRGFGELMEHVLPALPEEENVTLAHPLRVAVVGRPNVGKSSYINRLLSSERVLVSDVPGTTRDSIDIPFTVGTGAEARRYVLVDTAGMRRIGKIDNSVERFSRFRSENSIRSADICVLVLDGTCGPTAQDKTIAAQILEQQKGCVLLMNKWDLAPTTEREAGPALARIMPFMAHCPVVFGSAATGLNIRRSIEAIDHVAAQVSAKLPTGVLNQTIINAAARVQAPAMGGKRLKIFYSTQVGQEPLRIRLFVNDPDRAAPAYREYLTKCLRQAFGLEGAPVVLQFKARREKAASRPSR